MKNLFQIRSDCNTEIVARHFRTITTAEEDVSICLKDWFDQVMNVANSLNEVLGQNDRRKEMQHEQKRFIEDAEITMTTLMVEQLDCNRIMSLVMDENIAFDVCSTNNKSQPKY